MRLETLEAIGRIEDTFVEMREMQDIVGPMVKKLLPFRRNCALAGLDMEDITINLAIAENEELHAYSTQHGWPTIIGLRINWVAES